MPNRQINELPLGSGPMSGTELIETEESSNSRHRTASELGDFITAQQTVQNWAVPRRGVTVERTSDLTGVSFPAVVPWQQVVGVDTDGFFSIGQPTVLTIPAGITRVDLQAGVNLESSAASGSLFGRFQKNGASFLGGGTQHFRNSSTGFSTNVLNFLALDVEVAENDTFSVEIITFGLGDVDQILNTVATFFKLRVTEVSDADPRPFDLNFDFVTPSINDNFNGRVITRNTRILANAGQSLFVSATAATADTVIDVQQNGASIGSITFLSGQTVGTYTGAQTDFVSGDVLRHVAPANLNGISDLLFSYRVVLN